MFNSASYKAFDNQKLLTIIVILLAVVVATHVFVPMGADGKRHFGILVLVPVFTVLALALISRRTLEPLFVGACVGLLMLYSNPMTFVNEVMASSLRVMATPVMGWILLLSAMMGGLIVWLQASRATDAFSNLLGKYVKNREQGLLAAWGLGIIIFIDDYLSVLTVGAAMRKLTDKFKISRAMLSYVAAATGTPVCLLIPISTWAIYIGGLLESNGIAKSGEGMALYIQTIPYMFYAWIAILMVPLVIYKIIPPSPSMKAAELAAQTNVLSNTVSHSQSDDDLVLSTQTQEPTLWHFFIPIVVMVGMAWYLGDTLLAIICTSIVTLFLYRFAGLGSIPDLCELFMRGVASMVMPIAIIFAAFVLQDVNEQLGLAPYLIESVKPLLSAKWLPVVTFVLLAFLTFTTGSFWGIYAISIPIILPLAVALDANIPLTIGALASAGGFGSHACFFGDGTVLASRSCDVTPLHHATTQFRYALCSAILASLLFVVMA